MNDKKIAFIICTNNQLYCNECINYISHLNVPEGYEIDVMTIEGAEGIAKAYNEAIKESDAKYKVYLHQDLFIVNKNFIYDILEIFNDKTVGMIGLAGIDIAKNFFSNGFMWTKGELYMDDGRNAYPMVFGKIDGAFEAVQAIDGMIMITQYDLPWEEDLFTGWHYYDWSQSMVFLQNGYKIAVPRQENPWVMHDHGVINYDNYNYWMDVFLKKYQRYLESIG